MAELPAKDAAQSGPRCEYQVLRDKNPKTGILLLKKKLFDCGSPAGRYRCSGELTSLEMNLCDRHRDRVTKQYKWNLTKIEDRVGTQAG